MPTPRPPYFPRQATILHLRVQSPASMPFGPQGILFRVQASNLPRRLQRPLSCQLDEPESKGAAERVAHGDLLSGAERLGRPTISPPLARAVFRRRQGQIVGPFPGWLPTLPPSVVSRTRGAPLRVVRRR